VLNPKTSIFHARRVERTESHTCHSSIPNTSREQRHRYLDHLQNLLRARGNIVRIPDIKRIEVKNKSTQINRDQFLTRVNVGYLDYRSREPSTSP
jgi:hypothetical protein